MLEHWTGAWFCKRYCYETRHPQDFPKVVEDKQTVPVARPDTVFTMSSTTLAGDADIHAVSFDLTSVTGLEEDDPVSIVMDNGAAHNTLLTGDPSGSTITILDPMPGKASSGNTVYLPSINSTD